MTSNCSVPLAMACAILCVGSAAGADPRITGKAYHPSEVVTLRGGPGIESTIAFADDERIENIAVGDSAAWQVTPNKRANLLFVKPANARARTNMTVVTSERTYLFDLVSGSPGSAVYMLRFDYPDAKKPGLKLDRGDRIGVAEAAAPPPPPKRIVQHFAWTAKGEKRLIPVTFYDDGISTFLRWAKDGAIPAILARASNGAEGPMNFAVQGDTIVVDGVPGLIVLRSGKEVATLTPDPRRSVVRQVVETASAESNRPAEVSAP